LHDRIRALLAQIGELRRAAHNADPDIAIKMHDLAREMERLVQEMQDIETRRE
jgi:hypothetical protein